VLELAGVSLVFAPHHRQRICRWRCHSLALYPSLG
jgi:hypothetical protein